MDSSLSRVDYSQELLRPGVDSVPAGPDLRVAKVTWNAHLEQFPLVLDRRCVAEVVAGQKAALRIQRLVLQNNTVFLATGVFLHVVGIGSMTPFLPGVMDRSKSKGLDGWDWIWTLLMPCCCVWYSLVMAVSNYGIILILRRQFKPLYLLFNSLLFSVATASYFWPERGWFELTGKNFDTCCFFSIAFSDAIPLPLRTSFHRVFIPVLIVLYLVAIYPRLYLDVDGPPNGSAKVISWDFGSEDLSNTTVACQVLLNMCIWWAYLSVDSYLHPDSFRLLLARVQVSKPTHSSLDSADRGFSAYSIF